MCSCNSNIFFITFNLYFKITLQTVTYLTVTYFLVDLYYYLVDPICWIELTIFNNSTLVLILQKGANFAILSRPERFPGRPLSCQSLTVIPSHCQPVHDCPSQAG